MRVFRSIIALILTLIWCWSAWHTTMEGAGWMFDHHHHVADQQDLHEHPISSDHGHEPIYVRNPIQESGGAIFLPPVDLIAIWLFTFDLHLNLVEERSATQRRLPYDAFVWQFVQRCAPRATAPPALGLS